jgi:hypothetical protein
MTVRDTLTRAVRMTRARGLGSTPTSEEMTAMLDDFQNMLMALPRTALTDVLISANYTAGENERITDTSGTAVDHPADHDHRQPHGRGSPAAQWRRCRGREHHQPDAAHLHRRAEGLAAGQWPDARQRPAVRP